MFTSFSSSPTASAGLATPTSGRAQSEPQSDLAFRGTLTPEVEFVLLSARTRLEGARRKRWERLLQTGAVDARGDARLNWNIVLSLAMAHRVLGLLGRHLSARSWKGVPGPVKSHIQNYFLLVTMHSNALTQELGRISHLLESAGIPVVSFKGTTLGLMAYGNSVVRPSADLDLLVSRTHALRARDLLASLGYAPEITISRAQERVALRVDSVFNLYRPAEPRLKGVLPQGYATELHWAITSPCLPFDLEYETVEPRLGWIELPGVAPRAVTDSQEHSQVTHSQVPHDNKGESFRVRALAREDLLLILCVHGAKHLWERLIWLCDLAELVQSTPALDWERVLQYARERGVLRMTVLGLVLMRDVLGTPLPREVEAWLSTQPQALRLAAQLRLQLLAPLPNGEPSDGKLSGHLLSADALLMQTIDAGWNRLGFLWHLVTVPTITERATLDLPDSLNFLWCVVRPARALQKRWTPHSSVK